MSNPPATPPNKGRGCFFYGCLTCIVLLLLFCLLAFFAVRFVKNQVNQYTDAQPTPMPVVEMADPEFKELETRVKTFGEAMDQGKPVEPLVLSELEINALLVKSGKAGELANYVHVSLEGDQVKGQVSIPLAKLSRFAKDRYLNGEATFNVSLENGVLIVTAREVRVKGKPLPESFMGAIRQENLAKEAYKDAKNAEALRTVESLKVQDGRVIIKARVKP